METRETEMVKGWLLIFPTVFLCQAQAVQDDMSYQPASGPCAKNKTELTKNERLNEALKNYDPFGRHVWRGGSSDIYTGENGAEVRVHEDMQMLASISGEEPVQTLPIFEACADLNNKPFFRLGRNERDAQKIYLDSKEVTLGDGMKKDTYKISLGVQISDETSEESSEESNKTVSKDLTPSVQ
jgi:hypothetical protein